MKAKKSRHYAIDTQRQMLVETTRRELKADSNLLEVSGQFAHRWVRNGRTHSTGLWIDGNSVRYAEAMEEGVA